MGCCIFGVLTLNKTVKKIDIVSYVSNKSGININKTADIIDLFFDLLSDNLLNDKEVKIKDLGTFFVKQKKERVGRNLKTGDVITITPRNSVLYKPSKKMKDYFD